MPRKPRPAPQPIHLKTVPVQPRPLQDERSAKSEPFSIGANFRRFIEANPLTERPNTGNNNVWMSVNIPYNYRCVIPKSHIAAFIVDKGSLLVVPKGEILLSRSKNVPVAYSKIYKDIFIAKEFDALFFHEAKTCEFINPFEENVILLYIDKADSPTLFSFDSLLGDDTNEQEVEGELLISPSEAMGSSREKFAKAVAGMIAEDESLARDIEKFLKERSQSSKKAAQSNDASQPVPDVAPALWSGRDKKTEKNPAKFISDTYARCMDNLAYRDLLRLDRSLYFIYQEWKRKNKNSKDIVQFGVPSFVDDAERGRLVREYGKTYSANRRARIRTECDTPPQADQQVLEP